MPPSFFDLPPEIRLQVYDYFLPPVIDVGNAEDLLAAQRLRATCHRIRRELDEEQHRRISLAIKSSMGGQNYGVTTIHKASKVKVKFNIPVSFMEAEYQPDWDPRTSFSYRLMEAAPAYVQACYFRLVRDIKVDNSTAAKCAGRIMGGRIFYVLDHPELPVRKKVWMLDE